ncbi:hypothetical protein BCR41DRAFT_346551 [Lobosporangium transversale]|uniref:Inner centromere protein ARK-binding domain-containing protein n=1 Tax=Lobosporangium transversale TaxID=64571 RepID=A0A1Y2GZN2_9FUNG|nr:hypothetical protein BCR41DRAFT_346551 [Lobosporangium transversale]ORZ27244.1 hypothetical protein BCR41DRAFT_346551 [Lobosporangium transversale]|eukprot:XP_021884971.1 hypothetical protein BCR41DRAFT_346551 [Lobosporangium transversale]
MDNKRRVKDHEASPSRLWPILQRRRIEKLREQRQEEFVRACSDNFDWLENYYQGCVYAARQNKNHFKRRHYHHLSTIEHHDDGSDPVQHQTPPQQQLYTPRISSTKIADESLTFDDYNQSHTLDQETQLEEISTSRNLSITEKLKVIAGYEWLQKSHDDLNDTEHHGHLEAGSAKFDLHRPPTPSSHMRILSPRSPYERHRITKRTRLRVDASAATRKTFRALKALRKRASSYLDDPPQHWAKVGDLDHSVAPTYNNHSEQLNDVHSSDLSAKYSSDSSQTRPKSLSPEPIIHVSGTDHKLPTRPESPAVQVHHHSEGTEQGDNHAHSSHATPGLKARDSMTLLSPSLKPREQHRGSSFQLTPKLARSVSGSKRSEREDDLDQVDRTFMETSKKPRSSFQDSEAPVRFGWPVEEPELTSRLSLSINQHQSKNIQEKGKSQGLSNSEQSSETLGGVESGKPILFSKFYSTTDSTDVHSSTPYSLIHSTTPESSPLASYRNAQSSVNKKSMDHNDIAEVDIEKDKTAKRTGDSGLKDTSMEVDTVEATAAYHAEKTGHERALISSHQPIGEEDIRERVMSRLKMAAVTTAQHPGDMHEDGSMPRETFGKKVSLGDSIKHQKDQQSTTLNRTESSTTYLTSENLTVRPKVATALPEKRIVGQRKPLTQTNNPLVLTPGSQMPPSRLQKMVQALPLTTSLSHTLGSLMDSQPHDPAVNSSSKTGKAPLSRLSKDSSTLQVGAKSISNTSSSVSNQARQGVSRVTQQPMKATESGLARSDGLGSVSRKPLVGLKPLFTLKKPTRPVLPHSMSTTKSIALSGTLSGTSKAKPTAPSKIDDRRDVNSIQVQHNGSNSGETKKASTGSLMQPLSSIVPASLSVVPKYKDFSIQGLSALGGQSSSNNNCINSLDTPASVSSVANPILPAWVGSHDYNDAHHHEKTILPEIDYKDDDPENEDSFSRQAGIPAWGTYEELEKSMQEQSRMNPQDIFGPLPVLDMAEMFPGYPGKEDPKPRNSSIHWGTGDRLTQQEITRYNEEMGWTSNA